MRRRTAQWQRGRSTITAPCFVAVAMVPGVGWRLERWEAGKAHAIAAVAEPSLKAGGGFMKIRVEA